MTEIMIGNGLRAPFILPAVLVRLTLVLACRHPIPHPELGEDVLGVNGDITQLVAKPLCHVPQQPALAHPHRSPHPLEQHALV